MLCSCDSTEMRSHVLSPMHHVRRVLDSVLATIMPSRAVESLSLTEPFPTKRVAWMDESI